MLCGSLSRRGKTRCLRPGLYLDVSNVVMCFGSCETSALEPKHISAALHSFLSLNYEQMAFANFRINQPYITITLSIDKL